jgi:CxxC motif-containing protein (DUF1111 family)
MTNSWRISSIGILVVCMCAGATLDSEVAQAQDRDGGFPHRGAQAQDPGPRAGVGATAATYSTLNGDDQALFSQAMIVFQEVDSVSGTIEAGSGLGPTFNGNSCAQCHAQPDVGGSSPGMSSPQHPVANPQVGLATLDRVAGGAQTVPPFISANGPVREARFIRKPDGTPDGGVHDLYTIAGRSDAPGCTLAQPNFAQAVANSNVIFRIPTPLFGLGLVENTFDATLEANLASTSAARAQLGIGGRFNLSGNDGTITRFGWKAQNKSLLVFAGEAYNVEQGVSNELFPNERSAVTGCVFNPTPEDQTHAAVEGTGATLGTTTQLSGDVISFAAFIRLLSSAPPAPATASTQNGSSKFSQVGCALCHSPSLHTAGSNYAGLSNFTYHPYSDFALHHMGSNLADGVTQGVAGPDEFRTAPLWGVGQRLFFLHDGRTSDLVQAIQAHASRGSEANQVIRNFDALSPSDQQDVVNFLRSL